MGNSDRDWGGNTDPNPPLWHPHRSSADALKARARLEECQAQPRGRAAPTHSMRGRECWGARAPSARDSAGAAVGVPLIPPPIPGLQQSIWGEGQVFSSFSHPSLSEMKNLILVFTAPPRWINPFLASRSPGKSCESNAGPSGSHCSNSCFSPAALCKVL